MILSKEYGLADTEKKIPVDPDKTMFRIASVTWNKGKLTCTPTFSNIWAA
ncbi:hypothetical protein J7E73_20215 [Paenibacillus albidus]|nr:beta-lactamase family protein [Paenibacillus albidus]MBT2291404.1 hypothetical protein [Paenibacillus albidus]